MPRISDPKTSVLIGNGNSPNTNINNLNTQVNINQSAYTASQISTDPSISYLGDEVQSHLNDLEGLLSRPPFLGEGSKSFSLGALSASISGYPDWGVLKQADNSVFTRQETLTFDGVSVDSDTFTLSPSDTFFYQKVNPIPFGSEGAEPPTDPIFNIEHIDLVGGGQGASFLAGRLGDSETSSPNTARLFPFVRVTYSEISQASDGFTLSGFLFPADRGTLALVHWNSDINNLLTPASSVETIRSRVVAAINLNGGINPNDISIFDSSLSTELFPSVLTGQYDLYELQTAKYRADLSNGGDNIAGKIADHSLGSVRLLRDENAAFFGEDTDTTDTLRGHLPVLFGAYEWDTDTSDWVETEANFLAYRLPMLESYAASSLFTPNSERERFFNVVQPASTTTPFTTAGGYVTLGENQYTFQVARFRHVVKYAEVEGVSLNEKGSFALLHFKSETAFEKFVRDGIAPSSEELWGVNLFNYADGADEENTLRDGDEFSTTGTPIISEATEADSHSIVRSYVYVSDRDVDSKLSSTGYYDATFEQAQESTGFKFLRENGYYTTISGVHYLLPRFHSGNNQNIEITATFTDGGGATPFASPFYTSTTGELYQQKYRAPFNSVALNVSALTGSSNIEAETEIGDITERVSTQCVNVPLEYLATGIDESSTLDIISVQMRPLGDIGLCSFTEGLTTSALVRDPLYHYDGFGLSKVLVSTAGENSSEAPTTRVLYHSARLLSLIENCTTSMVNIYVNYNALGRAVDCAFSIFRYDEEGFRVYQRLNLIGSALQECSGLGKIGIADNFPLYPTYRASTSSAYTATIDINTPNATFEAVDDGQYYIEVHPTSDSSSNADYLQVVKLPSIFTDGDSGYADYQAIYDQRITQSKLYENPSNWYESYGTLGYLLGRFLTYENGYTNHNNTASFEHPYLPALVASDDYGKWIEEVAKSDGTELPTYGNFTEDELGIISVQGMSAPLGLTVVIPAWADSASTLDKRGLSTLFTARKDTQERFLDESYRIYPNFLGFDVAYLYRSPVPTGWDANTQEQLSDGGLPLGVSPIDFFVRDDSEVLSGINSFGSNHSASGYLRNGLHLNFIGAYDLPTSEVRALPPMSDAVLSGAKYGQPRRGVLVTPGQTDYTSSDYIPNSTYDASWTNDTGATPALWFDQPDNTEPAVDRVYFVRAFDVGFSRSGTSEDVDGDSEVKLRLVGVLFDDVSKADRGLIIQVKIPGKTAWLDIGKPFGYGDITSPSQDGAGCLVSARDGELVDEGVVCCDFNLNLGETLFLNSEGEATILVRVIHTMTSEGRALNFGGASKTPFRDRRGLVGVEVLRNSTGANFDGDAVLLGATHTLQALSVSVSDEMSSISDTTSETSNSLALRFGLTTNSNTVADSENFSIYTGTGITDISYPSVSRYPITVFPLTYNITVTTQSSPAQIKITPKSSITQNLTNFNAGYLPNISTSTYYLYAETEGDEATSDVSIAFDVTDNGTVNNTSAENPPLVYNEIFTGSTGTARYYIYEVSVNPDLSVDFTSASTGSLLTSLTLNFTFEGANTNKIYFSVYDTTDEVFVELTALTSPLVWQIENDGYTATFQAGQDLTGVNTLMIEGVFTVGHSYLMSCWGEEGDTLGVKMYVSEKLKWIEGPYGSSTTTEGEGYVDIKATSEGSYSQYFYVRGDGYLVFEYSDTPDPRPFYLGFSLETNGTVTPAKENFSLYSASDITDISYPNVVILEDLALSKEAHYKPSFVSLFPENDYPQSNTFEGYFEGVTPGTYWIYSESTIDTSADPEMNIAFETQRIVPSTALTTLTYHNLLPTDPPNNYWHIHEVVISPNGLVNFVSDVSSGAKGSFDSVLNATLYIQGTNQTGSSETPTLRLAVYDLYDDDFVTLNQVLIVDGGDENWTSSVDYSTATFTGDFVNSTDLESLILNLQIGHHYKITCYGSHNASLQIKIKTIPNFTDKWIEGPYGSSTTTAGEGYVELMPSGGGGNTYEHYFYVRADGFLVFQYNTNPI
jgi:hypothetical protein